MHDELIVLIVACLIAIAMIRVLPKRLGINFVAVLSGATLTVLSWQSALWLGAGVLATHGIMVLADRSSRRTIGFCFAVAGHLAVLCALRDLPALALIGGAYFTLRHIHVLSDWWTEALPRPSLPAYARYHFFLPVFAAGPVHRFGNFERQLARRRNDAAELASGAERTLWGAFQFTVLANVIAPQAASRLEANTASWNEFFQNWAQSSLGWITLYLSFAGLSSIAIGLALMMGLRIEENFNAPWRASNLLDFWSRWHMSLTSFSRDYVFRPTTAFTRSHLAGAFASMMFLGLWHGSDGYWFAWGVWNGLGILLTVWAGRFSIATHVPDFAPRLFAALWLTATFPVIHTLTGTAPQ